MDDDVPEWMEQRIKHAPPTWVLASYLKDAYQIPESEWEQVLRFHWEYEGEEITVKCNGSGRNRLWKGTAYHDEFPDPCAIVLPAGCHMVELDERAILKTKPDGQEFFCAPDRTEHFEEYLIRAIHGRIREKDAGFPGVEKFLLPMGENNG